MFLIYERIHEKDMCLKREVGLCETGFVNCFSVQTSCSHKFIKNREHGNLRLRFWLLILVGRLRFRVASGSRVQM